MAFHLTGLWRYPVKTLAGEMKGHCYGVPCPDRSVSAMFGGDWPSRLNRSVTSMLCPGASTPFGKNTRIYGLPVLVVPLAFVISTPDAKPSR